MRLNSKPNIVIPKLCVEPILCHAIQLALNASACFFQVVILFAQVIFHQLLSFLVVSQFYGIFHKAEDLKMRAKAKGWTISTCFCLSFQMRARRNNAVILKQIWRCCFSSDENLKSWLRKTFFSYQMIFLKLAAWKCEWETAACTGPIKKHDKRSAVDNVLI